MARVGVTARDVEAVDRAVAGARDDLSALWKYIFARNGLSFRSPAVKRYIKDNTVHCGADFMAVDNAWYCKENDTIWYDPIFLARMKKDLIGRSKRSAASVPILVLTHEWGHAVAMRLGFGTTVVGSFQENDADCYAGVAIGELIKARRLPASAMREAEELYEMIGAPQAHETKATISNLFRRHGTGAERKLSFMIGADSGVEQCRGERTYKEILRKVTRPPAEGSSASSSDSTAK
jgi:predicted metalloprotease